MTFGIQMRRGRDDMLRFVVLSLSILLAAIQPGFASELPLPQRGNSSSRLVCDPAVARPNDKISIELPRPHGASLAVIAPSGTYYFIAFNQSDLASPLKPIIPGHDFVQRSRVELSVKDARGINWSKNTTDSEVIFSKSGNYKIVVAETLETEDPILDGWCYVKIVAR